jgi:hypothetical protein
VAEAWSLVTPLISVAPPSPVAPPSLPRPRPSLCGHFLNVYFRYLMLVLLVNGKIEDRGLQEMGSYMECTPSAFGGVRGGLPPGSDV